MALELIVSPFLDVLFHKLSSLISREYRFLSGVNKDLEKLSKTLSAIKGVLVDAEVKQINDKRTRDWLSQLKDAAYDAEDLLDEWEYEALQQEPENCAQQVSDSLSACFDFKQILFRRKMGKHVKELIEKFNDIDEQKSKFQFSPGVVGTGFEGFGAGRETSSILTEPMTYGRDGEKESIVHILLENSSNDLSVCPIVGIGGLGKTTVAQVVYGDERVGNHFDAKIWICVSEDFGVKRITKMLVDHLSKRECDLKDLDPMQNLLKTLLNGRKYLLVLDDVWDDKQENWNKLIMCLLACGEKGSSIIVTTRLQTVVDTIAGLPTSCVINPTCNLKSLQEHDAWSLFEYYALAVGDREKEELVEIGKVIAEKCKGIPLAIKAVGSLLKSKPEGFWKTVRDSEIWQLEEHGEDTILPALRLSYYHLPPHYRQCFAYCSVYPKDWKMNRERLIHEWMANGFIQSSKGMEAEDIGGDIFNVLLHRSFFQDKQVDEESNDVSCKMHDLVHDLACSVTKNEIWRIKTSEMENVPERARHVSVTCDADYLPSLNALNKLSKPQPFFRTLILCLYYSDTLSQFSRVRCLRVLQLENTWVMKSVPSWIGHLKQLRYLNLGNTDIALLPEAVCGLTNLQVLLLGGNDRLTTLPPSVGKLKNLRYLDLSETSIKVLPESICTLTNLQTLRLLRCPKLEMLPRDMKNLKSLRNLMIMWEESSKTLIRRMPVGIGELIRLETLMVFVVSNAREGAAGIQELGRLNHLKGDLLIIDIRHVRDPSDAQQANLKSKNKLSRLSLFWGDGEDDGNEEEMKTRSIQVLESLEPHANIQILFIRDYPGVKLPSWLGNCARCSPNLLKLNLSNMPDAVHHLHQLPPHLETLWIYDCPKLRFHPELRLPSSIESLSVGASNDPTLSSVEALPHLSKLQIDGFHEQDTFSPLRNLTCLRELRISSCSGMKRLLTELPNLRKTLANLAIVRCDEFDCFTEEGLQNMASLQILKFQSCGDLTSLSDSSSSQRHLSALTTLNLDACPKLVLSAIDFQHLVTLQMLILKELPQLTSLPDGIRHVTTLQQLHIWKCKNLRMLPEWLQQRQPRSLHHLEIRECHPELHKRFEVGKISHLRVLNLI